jgi:hypothetical protein
MIITKLTYKMKKSSKIYPATFSQFPIIITMIIQKELKMDFDVSI